jgi:small GTP-binding protein
MNYDEKCQLLIIGDSLVGKTSILARFTENTFTPNYLATVGLDYFTKDEVFGTKTVRIKIWDTAGQERYKAVTQGFFRNANGIMIVYDITNSETFDNLKYWIQSIHTHIGEKNDVKIIIIGNKIDLQREVKKEDAEKLANEYGYNYFEVSAKTGENIDESIKNLVQQVLDYQSKKPQSNHLVERSNSTKLSNKDGKNNKGCGC